MTLIMVATSALNVKRGEKQAPVKGDSVTFVQCSDCQSGEEPRTCCS